MDKSLRSYKDLLAWQEAMVLAEMVYRLVSRLPQSEKFELSAQMRGSTVSVPSNIAEGYARESAAYYLQFLRIARGSLRELETQVLLAQRVGLVNAADAEPVLLNVTRQPSCCMA